MGAMYYYGLRFKKTTITYRSEYFGSGNFLLFFRTFLYTQQAVIVVGVNHGNTKKLGFPFSLLFSEII